VAVSDEARRKQARAEADETMREALEEAARATRESERVVAEETTPEAQAEGLRQNGVIYGGLVGVCVLTIQPFLSETELDTSATVSLLAFAVAIPLLAALVMVNLQEVFRGRRTTSAAVTVAQSLAQFAAVVGIAAALWHATWVAGATFVGVAVVAVGVHSAGFWRVESPRGSEG
jgi:hypothetical protein